MSRAHIKTAFLRHETILFAIIVIELVVFHFLGRRFLSGENLGNIVRQNVEVGLLALAMTPVILTGGIDLSVGSLIGLCAVAFGMLWQDAGLPPWAAAAGAIAVGALGGGINAALITRAGLPPLIVTLGTFSLFRGLAEAFTGGTRSFTNFPASFTELGNGYTLGAPVQAWIFIAAAVCAWVLVHRTTFGRSFRAIGYSPEGACFAGIPVARRVGLAYILSGAATGLAAVIFISRNTEARAGDGAGFELAAITAVVLGGTSIFGGTGSIHGTLLGWAALAILANGMQFIRGISSISRELSGMLTGVLLITALAASVLARRGGSRAGAAGPERG